MYKKKFQYSKILPLITFALFCGCVIKCFSMDISSAYDLTMHAAIITSSGALCLTSVVWYLKNSQAEKVAKIQADTYRIISEERYKYNEKMLALKQQYKFVSEDVDGDIEEIEDGSPLDELESSALDSLNSFIDSAMSEAISSIEAQTL